MIKEELPIEKLKSIVIELVGEFEGERGGLHIGELGLGGSIEFKEHKLYSLGDNLNKIDWKLLGRTNRIYIKEFEREHQLSIMFVLDISSSFFYKGEEGDYSKIEYAKILSLALSYIFLKQGDKIGISLFNDKERDYLPLNNGGEQWKRALEILTKIKDEKKKTELNTIYNILTRRKLHHAIVLIFSDLLQKDIKLEPLFKVLKATSNYIIFVQILTPEELTFKFSTPILFIDPEYNIEIELDPYSIKELYNKEIKQSILNLEELCLKYNIGYLLITTSDRPLLSLKKIIHSIKAIVSKRL